jgi:hypothetical protein
MTGAGKAPQRTFGSDHMLKRYLPSLALAALFGFAAAISPVHITQDGLSFSYAPVLADGEKKKDDKEKKDKGEKVKKDKGEKDKKDKKAEKDDKSCTKEHPCNDANENRKDDDKRKDGEMRKDGDKDKKKKSN